MKSDDVINHMAFENRLYFGSFQPEKHKTEAYQLKVTFMVSCTLTYEILLLLKASLLSEVHKKKSISPILGLGPPLLHVRLFLEGDRAWKMWQLSINHRDARIPRASLAEKRGGKNFEVRRCVAVAVGTMVNPFKTSCIFILSQLSFLSAC